MLALNIAANFLGKFWLLAISIVAVPVYIKSLGAEAFGLVGFFAVLLATLQLLEFGFGVVINREIARTRDDSTEFGRTLDLIRSLEIIYWLVGFTLAFVVYVSSSFIATNWLNSEHIEVKTIESAIKLMGLSIAFQWPASLYAGCLMGLERQVLLNVLQITLGTLRTVGAIFILWWVSPTLNAFFIWQVTASIIAIFCFAIVCWRSLPHQNKSAKFSLLALQRIGHFAAGVGATGIVTFLLSNLDKLILSKLISLSAFGHYNVANQINTASRMLPGAIFQALFPRLSSLYAMNKQEELVALYHKGSQLIAALVFPLSMILFFFSHEILYVWLRNEEIAQSAALITSILVLGSAINATLGLLYEMTIARGWAMYGFYQNLLSSIVIVPLMLSLVFLYGVLGAAIAWLILNIGYLVIAAPIMARHTLPRGELRPWYVNDLGKPFLVSAVVSALMLFVRPDALTPISQFFWIAGAWLLTQLACLIVLPSLRQLAMERLRRQLRK